MSKTVNKDLAAALADRHGLAKQDAERFVSAMFAMLGQGLRSDKVVKVKGLGTFKVIAVASRNSVDVNTGDPIVIEGRDKISFTPDATLRDEVNKPFAQFETVIVNDGVDFSEIDRKFDEEAGQDAEEGQPAATATKDETAEPEPTAEEPAQDNVEPEPAAEEPVQDNVEPEPTAEEPAQDNVEPEPTTEEPAQDNVEPKPAAEEPDYPAEENDTQDDDGHRRNVMRYALAASAAVVALCIAGAIYMFTQIQKRDNRIAHLEAQVLSYTEKPARKAKATPSAAPTDSLSGEVLTKEIMTAGADSKEAERKEADGTAKGAGETERKKAGGTAKDVSGPASKANSSTYDKDPRVRTGAYRITGIDRTITVKAGQTLATISRLYLGPGMECYVEAVNEGKTELKAGEKIHIPKLELKRKKQAAAGGRP